MKNVLVYNIVNNKERYDTELLFNYFRAQIDNSLNCGWDKKDIILATNFDFNYKDIESVRLNNICEYNIFNNKWYGIHELMSTGVLVDDFWFHDQDSWQIGDIYFPDFKGEIGACTYISTPEWNTASMFFKKSSKFIIDYIVEFMEMNNNIKVSSDENYIAMLRYNSEIKDYLTTINTKFNVGLTFFENRYNEAQKPVSIIGLKPNNQKDWAVFGEGRNKVGVKLVDDNLVEIFKKNSLL
tara:strand:+ start:35 stop:754 length:720 start_codon:yes stop_codon:yes gene_type:complete